MKIYSGTGDPTCELELKIVFQESARPFPSPRRSCDHGRSNPPERSERLPAGCRYYRGRCRKTSLQISPSPRLRHGHGVQAVPSNTKVIFRITLYATILSPST